MEKKASEAGIVDVSNYPPPYHPSVDKKKGFWVSSTNLVSNNNSQKRLSREQTIQQDVVKVWKDETDHSWKEFTNSTTFHGVKHIFEESPFRFRRLLWVICFMSAILFFVIQVAFRIKDYYNYDTNTDVQVKYKATLQFPAVTICNQNTFRMTKVVDREMYEYVDAVFASSLSDIDWGQYTEYNSVNSTAFLLQTSHQIEDMIDSCFWNAERCVMTDFKRISTDMGTCFTFNHDPDNPKYIQESGTGYGLQLIMNVEQYQAMRGPQNDAGLKILLHSPSEFPAVKNLGFSVAPGTHTLVGVHTTHVNSLEPPWGICSTTSDPMPTCKMQCRAKDVHRKCGCVAPYMSIPGQELAVCDLSYLFGCVRNVTDYVKPTENCNCTVPCERTVYEPRLSYAQLSRINIDRMVLTVPEKLSIVRDSFQNSLEVLQRVDSLILNSDEEIMGVIQSAYEMLNESLDLFSLAFNETSEIVTALELLETAAYDDKEAIDDLGDYFEDLSDEMSPRTIDMAERLLEYLFSEVGISVDSDVDYVQETVQQDLLCVDIITLDLPLEDNVDSEHIWDTYMADMMHSDGLWSPENQVMMHLSNDTSFESEEVRQCNGNITFVITLAQQFAPLMTQVFQHSNELLATYINITNIMFQDSGKQATNVEMHTECMQFIIGDYKHIFLTDVLDLISILNDVARSSNQHELSQGIEDLYENINDTEIRNYQQWFQELKDKCFWIKDWVDGDDFDDIKSFAENEFERAAEYFSYARSEINNNILPNVEEMSELMTEYVSSYVNRTSAYIAGSITKLSMVDDQTSMETTNAFEELVDKSNSLRSYFNNYMQKVQNSIGSLQSSFEELLRSDVPMLTNSSLQQLQTIQTIKNLNLTYLEPYTNIMIIGADEGYYLQPIMQCVEDYLQSSQRNQEFALNGEEISTLTRMVTELNSELLNYKSSASISADFLLNNFLHVDIYYSELSYNEVRQQKAFEILSLFSEVGGFMGLLLGASVLSVIEFVDYVVMVLARRVQNKARRTNVQTFA